MKNRAKQLDTAEAVAQRNLADLRAMQGESFGAARGVEFDGPGAVCQMRAWSS